MKKTAWWLRIVAAYYLLLFVVNVAGLVFDTDHTLIADAIPGQPTTEAVSAFIDAWVPFVLAIGTLGVVAAIASRRPERSHTFVLAVVVGELAYGIVGDLTLIARGYDVASYVVFIVVHLLVAGTGAWLLRAEFATRAASAGQATGIARAA